MSILPMNPGVYLDGSIGRALLKHCCASVCVSPTDSQYDGMMRMVELARLTARSPTRLKLHVDSHPVTLFLKKDKESKGKLSFIYC